MIIIITRCTSICVHIGLFSLSLSVIVCVCMSVHFCCHYLQNIRYYFALNWMSIWYIFQSHKRNAPICNGTHFRTRFDSIPSGVRLRPIKHTTTIIKKNILNNNFFIEKRIRQNNDDEVKKKKIVIQHKTKLNRQVILNNTHNPPGALNFYIVAGAKIYKYELSRVQHTTH